MSKPQKLPSGAWRIQFFDSTGKRRSETFATFDAARSAQRRRLTEVEDIRAGRARARSDQTLGEVYEEWLASRAPAPGSAPDVMRRRGKRASDNRSHLEKHILPELGAMRLPQVTAEVIQKFILKLEGKRTARPGEKNETGRTLKASSIANIIITLRKLLNDMGYSVRVKFKVPTTSYGWIKSATDVARFLEACNPAAPKKPKAGAPAPSAWFRMAAELACYAGLRQGEVAGLRWSAIDFERGFIEVERSYDGPVKSKHKRSVALAPDLAASLKRWRLETGAASGGLVVLMVKRGGDAPVPIDEQADLGKRTRRACKRAGVDPVTFHQLRHTYGSHLAERVPLPIVGAMLGHADPKTTARYAHIDTASLARDPRLHLRFEAPSGTVTPFPTAHDVHTTGKASGGSR